MNYGGGGYGGPPAGGGGYGPPPGGFGGPPGWGPPPPPAPMGPMGPPGGGTNGLAVASLVVGILALPGAFCCSSSIPLGIAAVVMGMIAANKLKMLPDGGGNNRTMAYVGVGCGVVGLLIGIGMIALGVGMSAMQQIQHH